VDPVDYTYGVLGVATSRLGAGAGALLLAAVPAPREVLPRPAAPAQAAVEVPAPSGLAAGPGAAVRFPPPAPDPRARLRAWMVAELTERVPDLGEPGPAGLAAAILEEATAAGLDPLLVLAMIEVESGWDPGAVSRRGARGLMQLRPATLASEARESGLDGDDPHHPEVNVRAGIRYLARLVRQFGDDDLALVAYNTGPTRLASYVQAVGEVPGHLLAYARRVRREERLLRRSLGAEVPPVIAAGGAAPAIASVRAAPVR
jgi:soluble lytic murein transglycosylase-like protein